MNIDLTVIPGPFAHEFSAQYTKFDSAMRQITSYVSMGVYPEDRNESGNEFGEMVVKDMPCHIYKNNLIILSESRETTLYFDANRRVFDFGQIIEPKGGKVLRAHLIYDYLSPHHFTISRHLFREQITICFDEYKYVLASAGRRFCEALGISEYLTEIGVEMRS